jgi:uncharacterized membrane protein
MDATRIHLFITHLPVFGLFLGFFALAFGLVRQDNGVKVVSLAIIIVAIVGGLIAFQTGEPAEEKVENIAGISMDAVELHEESAELTNWFFIGLGILAVVTLYLEVKGKQFARQFVFVVLAISALTFYFVSRTATLGGKIRHTEIGQPVRADDGA